MIKIGEWLSYLRKKGVYDNTRIIIVSDHGSGVKDKAMPVINYTSGTGEDKIIHASSFNCVLLVKDFGSKDGIETNDELITNAETPALATEDLIKDPVNPYTDKKISRFKEQMGEPQLMHTLKWQLRKNNGNVFLPGEWFTVKKNICDGKNWKHLGYR